MIRNKRAAFAVHFGSSPFQSAPLGDHARGLAVAVPLLLLVMAAVAMSCFEPMLGAAVLAAAPVAGADPEGDKPEGKKAVALADAEKRLTDAFNENLTKFQERIDEQLREIEEKGKASESLGEELGETKGQLESLRIELEKMRTRIDASAPVGEGSEVKLLSDRFAEVKDEFTEQLRESQGRGRPFTFRMKLEKESLFPTSVQRDEMKTTITSSAVGSATPGILVPDRVRDYVPGAERRFTMRDLLPSRPTEANTVEFPKENVFTNAASPQVEGAAKDESALTFTIASEAVRTLAHWIPATAQVLDDWAQLMRIIQQKMLYGLKLKEEDEILNGSGTGQHLNGLVTQATAYAGTYDLAADTRLDRLARAHLEVEDGDEETDFQVINPKTFWTIVTIKDAASNVGNYVVGDPIGGGFLRGMTLWGRALIVTNTMGADNFLVGSRALAEIFDRQEANVAISTEHSDYFVKNLVAIRVEERLALAVYRAGAFVYGSF